MDIPSKITGNTWTANEQNQITDELENKITSTGISLSSGDLTQTAKADMLYATNAASYVESGVADAYVIAPSGSFPALAGLLNGASFVFVAGNNCTGASTLNVNGTGVKAIKKDGYSSDLEADDIESGKVYRVTYQSSSGFYELTTLSNTVAGGTKGRLVKHLTISGTLTINESADDSLAAYLTSNDIKSGKYLIYVYGSGGGGGTGPTGLASGGGGGGISRVIAVISGSEIYTIGAGGSPGNDGGDTTILSTTSTGGGGGPAGTTYQTQGGLGGIGDLFDGGSGEYGQGTATHATGGGGGGIAGGAGGYGGTNDGRQDGLDGGLASGGGGKGTADSVHGTGGDGGDGYIEIYEWEA